LHIQMARGLWRARAERGARSRPVLLPGGRAGCAYVPMNARMNWKAMLGLVAMTFALIASGCAVGYTDTYPDNGYGPDLVYAAPGVQVIADYDEPVFFSDGLYWRFSGGYWYSSRDYHRGWVSARPPVAVLRIQHPQTYAHYRPAGWAPRG